MMRLAPRNPLQRLHHHLHRKCTLHRVVSHRSLSSQSVSPRDAAPTATDTNNEDREKKDDAEPEAPPPEFVNPDAITESPLTPDFALFKREKVYPYPRPYENFKIRAERYRENPLPKMSLREAVQFLRLNDNYFSNENFLLIFEMGIDMRKSNQHIRTSTILPHGHGRSIEVAVFAEGKQAEEAREAGADFVGTADLAEHVVENKKITNVIAAPSAIRYLGPHARELGMRGLMPNVKQGNVITGDVKQTVHDAKFRRVTMRTRESRVFTVFCGKLSYGEDEIVENMVHVCDHLLQNIPSTIKGKARNTYIKKLAMKTGSSRKVTIKLGEPPFVVPKNLHRGWGELPKRLLPQLEEQEKKRAFLSQRMEMNQKRLQATSS